MRPDSNFYANCPQCGYQFEWTLQEIIDQGSVVTCPKCETVSALKAEEDTESKGAEA